MTATAIGSYATYALVKARLGLPDDTDMTVITGVCDQVNQYIETKTGRVLAPVASATILLHGTGSRVLWYPKGIRAIGAMQLAQYTSAAYQDVDSSQYFLLPGPDELRAGWPATRIEFTDYPTGAFTRFPKGYNTVKLTTTTTGWAATPDDVTEVALVAAVRAWHAVQSGQTDQVGVSDMGQPVVSRFFSARDLETLRTYSVDVP